MRRARSVSLRRLSALSTPVRVSLQYLRCSVQVLEYAPWRTPVFGHTNFRHDRRARVASVCAVPALQREWAPARAPHEARVSPAPSVRPRPLASDASCQLRHSLLPLLLAWVPPPRPLVSAAASVHRRARPRLPSGSTQPQAHRRWHRRVPSAGRAAARRRGRRRAAQPVCPTSSRWCPCSKSRFSRRPPAPPATPSPSVRPRAGPPSAVRQQSWRAASPPLRPRRRRRRCRRCRRHRRPEAACSPERPGAAPAAWPVAATGRVPRSPQGARRASSPPTPSPAARAPTMPLGSCTFRNGRGCKACRCLDSGPDRTSPPASPPSCRCSSGWRSAAA